MSEGGERDPRMRRGGSARTRIQRRQLAVVLLFTCAMAPIFNVLTGEATLANAFQGVVDAVVITVLAGGYLLFVRDGWLRERFRRLSFGANFAMSGTILLALFLVGRGVGKVVTTANPHRFVTSFRDAHLVYSLPFFIVLAFAIQFLLQMNRMIGASVVRYFVAGVYHRPRTEERIFLFLDLADSTALAERLGSARYFELLRRVVDSLTEPILEAQGDIYQYAGDEVVITWPSRTGVRDANCIRCFFRVRDVIAGTAARYERDFGVVPRFRAGLHGGTVTAGELGDLKQQRVSRSTRSVRASTSWSPEPCWNGWRCPPASRRGGAASSCSEARESAWPLTASRAHPRRERRGYRIASSLTAQTLYSGIFDVGSWAELVRKLAAESASLTKGTKRAPGRTASVT